MLADDQPGCGFQDASQLSKHGRRIRHLSQCVDQIRAIEARSRVWKVLNVTDCRNDIDHAALAALRASRSSIWSQSISCHLSLPGAR